MKITTAAMALAGILLGGCKSLQPVDLPPEAVREQVLAGKIVKPGQRVLVRTEGGRTHEFVVVEVTDQAISGANAGVPIDSIVGLHTEQTHVAKTTLAVAGAVVVVLVAAAADAVANDEERFSL
ncbi:MAG: hypothetical protein OXQ90_20755 [Gammaproteobacteria bacterium]|nr:hypothetical protein [Gammaproteobacteria bacterium]